MGAHLAVEDAARGGMEVVLLGDAVVEEEPARLQEAARGREILRQARPPDMLEHADADDLIERHAGGETAVVLEEDADAVGQARRRDRAPAPTPPAGCSG